MCIQMFLSSSRVPHVIKKKKVGRFFYHSKSSKIVIEDFAIFKVEKWLRWGNAAFLSRQRRIRRGNFLCEADKTNNNKYIFLLLILRCILPSRKTQNVNSFCNTVIAEAEKALGNK